MRGERRPALSSILIHFSLVSFLPTALAQTCRWKNGQDATDYFACDPTAAQSSCCLQGEACVGNGLCYGSLGQIYRGACAGGWGNETACPEQCNDAGSDGSWANLFLCPNIQAPDGAQSWWCGDTSVVSVCDSDATSTNPGSAEKFSLPVFGMLPQAITPWASQNFTGCAVSASNAYSVTKQIEQAANNTGSDDGNDNTTTCSCPDGSNSNTTTSPTSTSTQKDCSNGAQIGEGVAIGVLALLSIALAGWAMWERKQKNKLIAGSGAKLSQEDQQYHPQYHNYNKAPTDHSTVPAYSPGMTQQPQQNPAVEIGSHNRQSRHELGS